MSTNHTEHYNLSLWEPDDQVTRTEFNENHAKIDAALGELQAGQLRIHTGTYKGTGTTTMTLKLPFKPVLLWIERCNGYGERLVMAGENFMVMSVVGDSLNCHENGDGYTTTWNGSTLNIRGWHSLASDKPSMAMNTANFPYMYIAIG